MLHSGARWARVPPMARTRLFTIASIVGAGRASGPTFLRADRFDRHGGGRFDAHQSSPLRSRRKRGAFRHAIGRSRGGRTTKIHALTEDHGRPLALQHAPGNAHDLDGARTLLAITSRPPHCRPRLRRQEPNVIGSRNVASRGGHPTQSDT
jgi:hypothetical protein